MSYFIGVDIGGTVTKAGLYDVNGQELHIAEKNSEVIQDAPGVTERDMNELWSTVCELISSCCQFSPEPVKGISFSSHGKGLYAIDKHGNPVRRGIISSDTRAESLALRWQQEGLVKKAYERGLQQLWTAHPVTLMAWLKEYEPQNYANVDSILMVHDYIRFRLSGEINAEITNISGSNMCNVREDRYDPTLLADFGIEECVDKTAPIVGSTEQVGTVTESASKLTGLKVGTPVYGGLFDVVAASITSCIEDDTAISAVAGTWSITTTVTDKITSSDYPYIWGNYCIPGKYFVHEGSPTSASNLAWFKNQFFPNNDWNDFNQWVASKRGCSDDLFFLPYLYGSNYKLGMPGSLIGLKGHHTKEDIIRSIYEGVVFAHLNHQDKILQLNPNAKTIRFTGGPTKSEPWMKLFTDASGLPVEVVNVQQSGCRAAALCAAVGYGSYKDFSEAIRATMPSVTRFEPDLAHHDKLRTKFERFNDINKSLADVLLK
jgi:L-xylulokinase